MFKSTNRNFALYQQFLRIKICVSLFKMRTMAGISKLCPNFKNYFCPNAILKTKLQFFPFYPKKPTTHAVWAPP